MIETKGWLLINKKNVLRFSLFRPISFSELISFNGGIVDDFEKELKIGFLEEASQLITDSEQCFLALEVNPEDMGILNQLFRLAHNLKGSSKAVGFDELGAFTHELESLLLKLKNKEMAVQTHIVNLLLRSNDHISKIIEALKVDMSASIDSSVLIAEIKTTIEGKSSASATMSEPAEITESAVDEEVSSNNQDDSFFMIEDVQLSEEVVDSMVAETEAHVAQINSSLQIEASEPEPLKAVPLSVVKDSVDKSEDAKDKKSPTVMAGASEESIRVSLARVEKLLDYVGEMVILQTVLKEQALLGDDKNLSMQKTVGQISKITKEVQDLSMSLRMVPLKQTFFKMQRIVRDTSKAVNKNVNLILSGEDTEVDKTVLENLSDPLVHIIRNAIDHGVEEPQARIAKGKAAEGTIFLSAYHQAGKLIIEIKDDGAGIDAQRVQSKAIEKGIIKPNQVLSEKEIIDLIFHPGFSTKAVVTDVSGRGVGMDVVKTNIEKNQGEVVVTTRPGEGSTFTIILPLTLAIIDGMVVTAAGERYVMPLSHIHETVRTSNQNLKASKIGELLLLRGENLPLYRLSKLLSLKEKQKPDAENVDRLIAIVVRQGPQPFAILVDDIIGQQQVVIKKLSPEMGAMVGYSGSSILGDGRPALILEVSDLIGVASGDKNKQFKDYNNKGLAA